VGVGSGTNDISNTTEVVGEGPEDVGGSGIGEEFVLLVWSPEVVVRNGVVINLDGGLVVFGDEDCLFVADNLANPDVVVVVGVFYDLNGRPFLRFGVKFLFCDRGQAVAIVPAVRVISVTLNIGKIPTYLPHIRTERIPAGGAGKTN